MELLNGIPWFRWKKKGRCTSLNTTHKRSILSLKSFGPDQSKPLSLVYNEPWTNLIVRSRDSCMLVYSWLTWQYFYKTLPIRQSNRKTVTHGFTLIPGLPIDPQPRGIETSAALKGNWHKILTYTPFTVTEFFWWFGIRTSPESCWLVELNKKPTCWWGRQNAAPLPLKFDTKA